MDIKSDLRLMVMEGVEKVPNFLLLSSNTGATTLSQFSPYDYLFMPTTWHSSF